MASSAAVEEIAGPRELTAEDDERDGGHSEAEPAADPGVCVKAEGLSQEEGATFAGASDVEMGDGGKRRGPEGVVAASGPGSEARVEASGCEAVTDTAEGAIQRENGCNTYQANEAEVTAKSVSFSDSHSLYSYQEEMDNNKVTGLQNLEDDAAEANHTGDEAASVRATEDIAHDSSVHKGESGVIYGHKERDLAQKVCPDGNAIEASIEGLARHLDQREAVGVAEVGNSAKSSLEDAFVINNCQAIGHQVGQSGSASGDSSSVKLQMEHSEAKLEITMPESLNAVIVEGTQIDNQHFEEIKGEQQHNVIGTDDGVELEEERPCLGKGKRSMNEKMQVSPTDTCLRGDEDVLNSEVSLTEDGCGGPHECGVDLSDGQCSLEASGKSATVNIKEIDDGHQQSGAEVGHSGNFSDVGMIQAEVSMVSNNVELSERISCMVEENQRLVDVLTYNVVDGNSHASESTLTSKDGSQGEAMIVEATDGGGENKDALSLEISQQDITQALDGEAKINKWSAINSDQNKDSLSTLTACPDKVVVDNAIHEQEINLHEDAEKTYNLNSENLVSAEPVINHQLEDAKATFHIPSTNYRCATKQILAEELQLAEKDVGAEEREDEKLVDENVNEKEDTSVVASNSISDFRDMVSENRGSEFEETHGDLERDGAYHPLYLADGNVMDKEYFAMEGLNLSVEISMPENSELSEIQGVFSLAIDSTEVLLDKNQEAQSRTLSSTADGLFSPGFCQNVDGNEVMEVDSSSETGCAHEMDADERLKTREGDFAQDENLADISDAMIIDEQGMVGDQEPTKGSDKLTIKHLTMRTGTSSKENDQCAHYCLPSKDENGFSISDLVWGKVKSHPWWPGQIFDPSDASDLALKHQKKDNFLVAYFADKTFAWCDESQLKPFCLYFSQMEKQSSSDVFLNAVNGALEEVSRRIELGMTCLCWSQESNSDITRQKVENAGIREGYTGCVIERSHVISYFKPAVLLAYIKALAQMAAGGADKLDLVIAKAHLKSFYRSKGYSELPCFQMGIGGLSQSDAGLLNYEDQDIGEDCIGKSDVPLPDSEIRNQKSAGNGIASNKEKQDMGGNEGKIFPELFHEATCRKPESKGRVNSEQGVITCDNKRLVPDSDSSDSERRKKKKLDSLGDGDVRIASPTFGSSFKLGACISRVASQLTGSPSILKTRVETFQKNITKDGDVYDVFVSDAFQDVTLQSSNLNIGNWEDYSSLDVLLSQLYLAASDPMKKYTFHSAIISFFSEFRNHCVISSTEKNLPGKVASRRGRKRKVDIQIAASDVLTTDHMNDSYWSDLIPSDKPVDGLRSKGQATMQGQRKRRKSSAHTCSCVSLVPLLHAELQEDATINPDIKQLQTLDRSIISVEEKMVSECTPTSLILDFKRSETLPSRTDLIRTFSCYGPLKEAATEVHTKYNRVKVVFKRRADAERAFNSAGKYSIFGPSLLSYRLRYFPSIPDTSLDIEPQDKSNAASYEGSSFETSDQAQKEIISDTLSADTNQVMQPVNTAFQVDEPEETCRVDEMVKRANEVDGPPFKVNFQVDESVQIVSETDERVYPAAQGDSLIETSPANEPFEADAKPVDTASQVDGCVKLSMLVDERVKTAELVYEPVETAAQLDENVETTVQVDEPVGKDAEQVKTAAQVDEDFKVAMQVDELVKTVGNVDESVETAEQVDKHVEVDCQADGMVEIDAEPAEIVTQVDEHVEKAILADALPETAKLVDEPGESTEQVGENTEVYAQLDQHLKPAAKLGGPVKIDAEPVKTVAQVDEEDEIAMQVDEPVETIDQVNKAVGIVGQVDQYVEIADHKDKQVEIAAQLDGQVERAAQVDENVHVAAQIDEQVEIAGQGYEIAAQVDGQVEIAVQVGEQSEIAMQVDEPVKTTQQVDKPVETAEQVYQHVEIAEQVDKRVEIALQVDELVEIAAQVDENIKVAQVDEQAEIAGQGDEMIAQVNERVEIAAKVDEHVKTAGWVDEQIEITDQADEPVGITSHMNEPVKVANHVDEPVLSTDIAVVVDEPDKVSAQVDEPITVATQVDEPVKIAAQVDEPVERAAEVDEAVKTVFDYKSPTK